MFLLVLAEIVLLFAISLPLLLYAPPAASLIVIVLLLLTVYFVRPAKRLSRYIRHRQRHVERRFRARAVPSGITFRPPMPLSPAEVFRLMELTGAVPENRRDVADFTATLLDLNRRGVLALRFAEGDTLLRADGVRVVCRRDIDMKKLAAHERSLIHLLRRASGPVNSIRLSALQDYVRRSAARVQKDTDAFRRHVDRALLKKRRFGYIRVKTRPNARRTSLVCVLTPRGEQAAALWRAYLRNICTKPYLASYQPQDPQMKKAFAEDAERIMIDAAACGYCARAAGALMQQYLFDPIDLWHDDRYFSWLTETRTAFAQTDSGEDYFFLPLRHFETAIKAAVLHGTSKEKYIGFENI
ncbi:MAG: DUF2207 domain-containing protein [Clostridia bacterium]|nr:DUF2207 domain-containing protein [Clostridia bacterium]